MSDSVVKSRKSIKPKCFYIFFSRTPSYNHWHSSVDVRIKHVIYNIVFEEEPLRSSSATIATYAVATIHTRIYIHEKRNSIYVYCIFSFLIKTGGSHATHVTSPAVSVRSVSRCSHASILGRPHRWTAATLFRINCRINSVRRVARAWWQSGLCDDDGWRQRCAFETRATTFVRFWWHVHLTAFAALFLNFTYEIKKKLLSFNNN